MGEHERWLHPPTGLLPNESASVMRVLDSERWLKAEERTAELIACIQPNPLSEERRNAVVDYVQRLIMKCFPCQVEVFTFGSVPLKTYLPDGDIDLTAFSNNQGLKDTWAHQVRDMLESEEKNENAEFHVKEVQYIQAEVKIIKCLVENIVVDISFNQLGGLCTLCFLEEVDHLINQNHLFKRSIILIKAWCYYESRILGAHHGLISTYALETLVLYIFHVLNNSFAGPLEVLYRFLEFFSKFDWDNFCVSLWGPVPIFSLPDVTAESPRKDGGELLLSKLFLDACSSVYAVFPGGQENQGQSFVSKHFNVIDPLRVNNNLGRSVSKGNFFRIRSAFAFGAKRLARLLDCPKEDLFFEVNQFFMNTWERHGSGHRPDAPRNELWHTKLSNPEPLHGSETFRNNTSSKKIDNISNLDTQDDGTLHNFSVESAPRTGDASTSSRIQNDMRHGNQHNSRISDKIGKDINSNQGAIMDKGQSFKSESLMNDIQGRFLFARTRSSPELTDAYGEAPLQGRRNRALESRKSQTSRIRLDTSWRKNQEYETSASHVIKSADDSSSVGQFSSKQILDAVIDSKCASINFQDESSSGGMAGDFASVSGAQGMQQEEQDIVNMMASATAHGYNGQVHVPLTVASGHLPLPIPPSILASMGYAQRNMGGMIPPNIPLIETPWGANIQFPRGVFPTPFSHYFPGMGLTSNAEDGFESVNENFGSGEADNEFWQEQDLDNGSFEMLHSDDKQHSISVGYNYHPLSRVGIFGSSQVQQKFSKDNRSSVRKDADDFQYQNSRGSEICFDEMALALPPSRASSLRSKTSSESSWEGSSAKVSKSTREKRGRKTAPSGAYEKGKSVSEHTSTQADDDNRDWNSSSTIGSENVERNSRLESATLLHVPRHQLPGFEPSQASGTDSLTPFPPVLLGPGSRQRAVDHSGVASYAFYPTGPPVPFFTMLPVYNIPTEKGTLDASTSHFGVEEALDSNDSGQNFDSSEGLDQPETPSTSDYMRRATFVELSEHKPDILHSDFASHWQNLQYGRLCQNPRFPSPLIYRSPVMASPVHLPGRILWDGPGRSLSANMSLFTQYMSQGTRLVPVAAPLQSLPNRPTGVYHRYVDEMPRYRSGTGTYLPNPKVSFRNRHSASTRRGNYNCDRNDHHGDREGNWNASSRSRTLGRSHNCSHAEKLNSRLDRMTTENQTERSWGSHRHDSSTMYQSRNGPIGCNSVQSASSNVAYGMDPLPAMNSSGVSLNGPTLPSVVMLYPYDHNASYGSPAEQLEFGSLGTVDFSSVNDVSQQSEGNRMSGAFDEQRFLVSSTQRSSPDQPSSPHIQR